MSHVKPVCRCGCGQLPGPRAVYVNGHNHFPKIRVVGMTFERALQIAVESQNRTGAPLRIRERAPEPHAGNGRRLTVEERDRITRLVRARWSNEQIAEDLGITTRTVERVRANERKTA